MDTIFSTLVTTARGGPARLLGTGVRRWGPAGTWGVAGCALAVLALAAQTAAPAGAGSALFYRLWFLSGPVLGLACFAQAALVAFAPGRRTRLAQWALALAAAGAAVVVATAPVTLARAGAQWPIDGSGMGGAGAWLPIAFTLYGVVILAGVVGVQLRNWAWSAGSGRRTLGVLLFAAGAWAAAGRGTPLGSALPAAAGVVLGLAVLGAGAALLAVPAPPPALPAEALGRRRQRVSSLLIGLGATVVLGSVAVLPAIPWAMGIVKDVKHVYIPSIPTDNTGAYLVTDQGVMQLFTWYVEPDDFPEDAPTIPAATLHSIAAVQKQHDVIENYQLWNVDTIQLIPWVSWNDEDGYRTLDLPSPLPPGSYMFVLPSDSMYGGATWHFFKVQ